LSGEEPKGHRAGQTIDDLCRACKAVRAHTIIAVDADARVLRVMCDFCRSQHNYRDAARHDPRDATQPLITEPERTASAMTQTEGGDDLERTLRRLLRDELGLTPGVPAEKWRGGELVLRPGKLGVQEKKWPIDAFFHKIVMIRNKLRTLEQQVNASDMPEDAKLRLQSYVTSCYGSLTSFNILFADEEDQFKGSSTGD
jgi:hypothetical protein